MTEIILTLLISAVPACIAGVASYLGSMKKASTSFKKIQEKNKHELEKLMEQHKIDLDSLKETHKLDLEKMERQHQYELEMKDKEMMGGVAQEVLTSFITMALNQPDVQSEISTMIKERVNR